MPDYIDKHPLTDEFQFFLPSAEMSRNCPYCGHAMVMVHEGLSKCLYDGYTYSSKASIQQQHHYDMNRAHNKSRRRIVRAYPETQFLPQELEYNLLVESGWTNEEAFNQVVADMNLVGDALYYFEARVNEQKEDQEVEDREEVIPIDRGI